MQFFHAVPRPEGNRNDFVGYCHIKLFHRDGKQVWQSDPARIQPDAVPVHEGKADDIDVIHLTWDQTFEWTFDADALAFLQYVSPLSPNPSANREMLGSKWYIEIQYGKTKMWPCFVRGWISLPRGGV